MYVAYTAAAAAAAAVAEVRRVAGSLYLKTKQTRF